MDELMNSWYNLLNQNVTYNSAIIPVYKEDAPADATSHYILLRAEGETDQSANHQFHFASVVVVDVVTVHKNNIKRSIVDDISTQIFNLVFPVKNANALPAQQNIQILNAKQDTTTYLYEDDGVTDKVYRKVIRYSHTIIKR